MENNRSFSNEKLISAVKDLPIIYDTAHPDYYCSIKKKEIWEDVAKRFNMQGLIKKYLILFFFRNL